MAETAYERFLLEEKDNEAIEVEVRDPKPLDLEQVKMKIQEALTSSSEPKKPVKWFAKPNPKNVLSLMQTLQPGKRMVDTILTGKDPMEAISKLPGDDKYNATFKVNDRTITEEKDYIAGLDEISKGIQSGITDLQNSVGSLFFAGTDIVAGTDLYSAFEKAMDREETLINRPETWRGEVTSILTQFGVPGSAVTKLVGRIPAISKIWKAANSVKGGKARKISQVATRSLEGATIVGVTDFLASEPGRESLFFEPESTEGLSGRKKAGVELRNRVKYGLEGVMIGGGFPLVGKATQLGYKFGLKPLLTNKVQIKMGKKVLVDGIGAAQLGAKGINNLMVRPAEYLLGADRFKLGLKNYRGIKNPLAPVAKELAKEIQNATGFTINRLIAPAIISGMSKKIVTQLPPFEKWRLKSITSPKIVDRSLKSLDNKLSWFRSYGKAPKDIEGVSEAVQLYIKARARKIDRTYEGLEKTAYQLAKTFEGRYNKATTSDPMEKYYLDQIDEVLKGQRLIDDIPKELQALTKDLMSDIKKIMSEMKKALPKGKEADEIMKDMSNLEVNNINKYLVRSFKTFTNPEHVPEAGVMDKAIGYLVNNVIKKNRNLRESAVKTFPKLDAEEAYKESARMHAEDILRTGKAEGKSPLVQLKEIGTRILQNDKFRFLKTGEELPTEIKNLLGPERNLKGSVAYTTSEAIASMANKRAADYIAKSGVKNGWLFNNAEDAINAGFIGAQKITKVPRLGIMKSDLLNKYTSPEYVQMFQGVGNALDKLVQMAFYRHAIQFKVGVQIGKTLYSPQTQVRNVTSASFFSLMNGHVGNRASVADAMRIVARDIFKAGGNKIDEVEFNTYVEKLVRLGVWDENVVASEMKAVLSQLKDGSINTTDALFDKLMKMAPTDKVARVYAGGDNLWKQYGWEYGKSQLSQGLKNIDDVKSWFRYMGKEFDSIDPITGVVKTYDDAIDEGSAYLLRNTYPTYSKVPPVIQELRKLPFGNFISFPAEILRTGTNIISTGLKEAAHPNEVIRQMGLRRLTGAFLTSYAIGNGFQEISQVLTGSTDSQWDAYKRSSAASWDANSNLLAVKEWKNGESAAINFSYFSPYDSLAKPLEAAIAQARAQDLNPQETEQFVLNLMFAEDGPVRTLIEPFVSEPLGFDRFIDVTTRNGRKDGGGFVYTQTDDLGDKFIKSFAHILNGVKPGIITSGGKIGDALTKDLTKGGKPVNLMDELLALFTGTRIIRIDVKKDLRYFTRTMNANLRAVDETEQFYSVANFASKTPTDMVKTFDQMQQEALRVQRDMYIRMKDLELLDLSRGKIFEIMKAQGTPSALINNLISGRFTPVNYSKPRFENKVKAVKDQMKNLNKNNEDFYYSANRTFLFPQTKLDRVKAAYGNVKFFPETYNEETKQFEGGYYPDREKYQTNEEGNIMYDQQGKPVLEQGFIERTIRKIPGAVKDLIVPGAPKTGLQTELPTPPLPESGQPKLVASAPQINQSTGLTTTQEALLSPSEKVIAQRQTT